MVGEATLSCGMLNAQAQTVTLTVMLDPQTAQTIHRHAVAQLEWVLSGGCCCM
jgi:hypothetical protein